MEIARKAFGSLHSLDGYNARILAGASHIVQVDGNTVYKFWADDDEQAIEVFEKWCEL